MGNCKVCQVGKKRVLQVPVTVAQDNNLANCSYILGRGAVDEIWITLSGKPVMKMVPMRRSKGTTERLSVGEYHL